MNKPCAVLAALLIGTCSGCATVSTVEHIDARSPRYFTGTRANIAALRGDRETLDEFAEHSMFPAEHPLLDLPFSFVLDAVHFWWAAI